MHASSGLLARREHTVPPVKPRLRRVLSVLDLDASRKFGSLEEQMFLLARAFQRESSLFLPLYIAPPCSRGLVPYEEAGLEVASLDLRRFRVPTLLRLLRLVIARQIEVIDWNFYPPLLNLYPWLLTLCAPWVQHYFTDHNSRTAPTPPARGLLSRLVKRVLLRRYARVIGVSQFVVDSLQQQQAWSNLTCRLHFVNTERFAPAPERRSALRKQFDADDRFVLLSVANLIADKGIDVALRALRELPEQVVLWIVGDGEEHDALRTLTDELGLGKRVRFLGLQSEVEPYLQAADCFVCPSRWAEAAGLVCIEAQACGLPVVASDIGGIPEYVADNHTGFLSPAGDAEQLARRVRRLFDDPESCRRLGRQAREEAVERFSVPARLDDYLDLYRA
jgi:glycosyltransferase involved in cell wall biosynthesis